MGVSVVVACSSPGRGRWCAGSRLFGSWAALPPLAIPLTGLLLHRDILRRLSVAGLWVHSVITLGFYRRDPYRSVSETR
jgi:hypothetical protein